MGRAPAPRLDADLLRAATRLRQELHQNPETANEERQTAARVTRFLKGHGLAPWKKNLGGNGLLYRIQGKRPGPSLLFRADLDALPIHERTGKPYASRIEGRHHACGHDGHMATLAASLAQLARRRDFPGTVYGVFQPAEETGEGAELLLRDLRAARPRFDAVFAIHNFPGLAEGRVVVREGTAAKPSMGLEVRMSGRRSHASEPHKGRNPIPSIARLVQTIQPKVQPARSASFPTIVAVNSGPPNYGVSPGVASVSFTLRGARQADLDRLHARVREHAKRLAKADGLKVAFQEHDVFRETRNHPSAVARVRRAAALADLRAMRATEPLSASEDFGRFTEKWPGALVLVGAGRAHAPLHSADYDFPDATLADGAALWLALANGA